MDQTHSGTQQSESERFDTELGELAGSLGDATRRGIYIAVRESSDPLTASQIAEMFDIHPNVARHHLDRLATDDFLTITRKRPSGRSGPGAGRPAKCYTASDKEIELHYPAKRVDLLATLLLDLINELAPETASETARDIGYRYGSRVAEEIGLPSDTGFDRSVRAVAQAMTGLGFQMEADVARDRLVTSHCPFGQTALTHPEVVCSLDQGLIAGLMASVDTTWQPVVFPHASADGACVTRINR
jgi:predicted ArsR family transcriptional regulator